MNANEASILILVGVTCLAAGVTLAGYILYIRLRGFQAFAQVLSVRKVQLQNDEGRTYTVHKPLLEIINEQGNWKAEWLSGTKVFSHIGTSWDSYYEDEILQVYYIPETKQIFTLKHLKQSLQIGFILCGIGCLIFLTIHLNRGLF